MDNLVRMARSLAGVLELAILISSVGTAADPQLVPGSGTAKAAPERAAREAAPKAAQTTPRRVTANKPVTPPAQAHDGDAMIATCLAISNEEEIALAKLALSKSKNDKVHEFAEMMVKDHSDMRSKLERFGAQAQSQLSATDNRQDKKNQDDAHQRTAGAGNAGFDFLGVKRQIAQQCVDSARKMWEEKKGSDADMAYLGQQCVLHQQMIDAQTVLRQYASTELQSLMDKAIDTAQSHKKHVEQLIEEVAHEKSNAKSRG